jgi:hypothetical protein
MRWPLEQKCKGTLTLKKILADTKLTEQLVNYIDATDRFSPSSEFPHPHPTNLTSPAS